MSAVPIILQFRPLESTSTQPPLQALSEPMTLRRFYDTELADWRANLKDSTRALDREVLKRWTRHTNDPDFRSYNFEGTEHTRESLKSIRRELHQFVRGELASGISRSTINKHLTVLKTFLRRMADPIEYGVIPHVPDLGIDFTGTTSRWSIKATYKPPRKLITDDEFTRIFEETKNATSPATRETGIDPVLLWRVWEFVLWSFGARTRDNISSMNWEAVDFDARIIRFTAQKTSKLQGLPMTSLMETALRSICVEPTGPIFRGFDSKGTWCRRHGWRKGYYTTWNRDICPAAGFQVEAGPPEFRKRHANNPSPPLKFHHFRKTAISELNCYSDRAGAWVAAHSLQGVTEKHYDTPDERVTKAVHDRERERLPACFREYFESL